MTCVGRNAWGCFRAADESVKGVMEAVMLQPDPEPVASTAVSVARPSPLRSKPLRVVAHLRVDGAAIANAPPATVAVPLIVQVAVTLSTGTVHWCRRGGRRHQHHWADG